MSLLNKCSTTAKRNRNVELSPRSSNSWNVTTRTSLNIVSRRVWGMSVTRSRSRRDPFSLTGNQDIFALSNLPTPAEIPAENSGICRVQLGGTFGGIRRRVSHTHGSSVRIDLARHSRNCSDDDTSSQPSLWSIDGRSSVARVWATRMPLLH